MSACAAVAMPNVATTALQILIHFMTQSLLPLGFGIPWAVSIGRRRAGKIFIVGFRGLGLGSEVQAARRRASR
jgi:hypothetical protein